MIAEREAKKESAIPEGITDHVIEPAPQEQSTEAPASGDIFDALSDPEKMTPAIQAAAMVQGCCYVFRTDG